VLCLSYIISVHLYLKNCVSNNALKYFAAIVAEGYFIITISLFEPS
jgi:hypothetical protein